MKDVNIKITPADKTLLDNLIKIISRSKVHLEGVEILAAADSMRWLSRLQKQIEVEQKATIDIKPTESKIKRGSK